MTLSIAPLDPADDAAIDEMVRLRTAVRAVDAPDLPQPCRFELAGGLRFPATALCRETHLARLGDAVVGAVDMRLPMRDNTDNAEIDLIVHPAHRRQGVGRQLYAYTADRMRELGRKRVVGMTAGQLPGGPARDDGGTAFAEALGAHAALGDVRRRLDLSYVDDDLLARLRVEAWRRAEGYTVVPWLGAVPDEYLDDVAYLDSRLVKDAPIGDLAWEPEQVDGARVREGEAQRAAQGYRVYSVGAVHQESGRMVALTAIGRTRSVASHAYQWITIVDPDHRGHRLGLVVKLENLRLIRSREPELRTIDTWNAAVNDHMISINEQIGFRPVEGGTAWQIEV